MNDNLQHLDQWATWQEIHAQPAIWKAWSEAFDVGALRHWISELQLDEIWFCGAGTSSYLGEIVVAGLEGQSGPRLRSVPSTDLVSRPQAYLAGHSANILFVSFGRSGNSTESIGTLDALDALAPLAPRLHITCNRDGALATRRSPADSPAPQKTVVLPDATHDAGFAMTSSFSTMLFTALALFDEQNTTLQFLPGLAEQLDKLLPIYAEAAGQVPERVVYLGSGALSVAARESALKVLELSAGKVAVLSDSVLGFRHGPKSFVSENTSVVIYLSPDSPTREYEIDLCEELRQQFPKARVTTIGTNGDIDVNMICGPTWSVPLCVASAQVAGVLWSSALGLNVDNPFEGLSTLSRVVAGVKLYPVAT